MSTKELSADEALVHKWLCERGYPDPEYEPEIIGSRRRPDFLAVGDRETAIPNMLWAEVKSLQPDDSSISLSKIWPVLKESGVPAGVSGHAMLHVTPLTRPQSVRALLKIFQKVGPQRACEKLRLIFLQQNPDKNDIRVIKVSGPVMEEIWVRGSCGGKIGVVPGTVERGSALATWEDQGAKRSQPAFRIFDWQHPFDCALVAMIDPQGTPIDSISSMASGNSTVASRTLNALEEANSQLRAAVRNKPAPGIVFVVPAEDHTDDLAIATAAYGKLTVPINLGTHQTGEGFFGDDGAFRRDKNTHISLVIRLRRNGGVATYFLNPFAKIPVSEEATLLQGLRRATVTFK